MPPLKPPVFWVGFFRPTVFEVMGREDDFFLGDRPKDKFNFAPLEDAKVLVD